MLENQKNLQPPAKILASAANGILELIPEFGGDIDSIFGRASINTDALEDPYNELNLNQFCNLFDQAAKQTGNDNFGLAFGKNYRPKRLGPIGYAAISCPTLSAALRCLEEYFPAHQQQSSFKIVQDSDILWLNYRIFDERVKNRRQDAELSIGVFINVFRHALGDAWSPLEIKFEHNRPEGYKDHETVFNAPVKYGRRTNSIAFRRTDLDTNMPEQDPYLYSIIEPFLKTRCSMRDDSIDFAAVVREQIKIHLGDTSPTIKDIVSYLDVPEKIFHQELKARNLTYKDLLRAARKELALHFLNANEISLTEVALRLGYSELSAFSRAFRSWTGLSPQRYRRNNSRK